MIRKFKLTSDGMAIITVLMLTVLLALMTVSMVFNKYQSSLYDR